MRRMEGDEGRSINNWGRCMGILAELWEEGESMSKKLREEVGRGGFLLGYLDHELPLVLAEYCTSL
jgi:hypothetical protein